MWQCKDCKITVSTRYQLLKHYRLMHGHYGRRNHFPCTYSDCPCRFKTWNALHSHLNRYHAKENTELPSRLATFNCHVCSCSDIASEREYFSHIYNHLKSNETVHCMFEHCSFQTNACGTFKSHKNRKHNPYSLQDFKPGVVRESGTQNFSDKFNDDALLAEQENADVSDNEDIVTEGQDLSKTIELKFASILLKLENYFHVPSNAINELITDLQYMISSASVSSSTEVIHDTFQKHNLCVDHLVMKELISSLSSSNPLLKATTKDGPLATAFKRMKYYRDNFDIIDPVEMILQSKKHRSFQYIPIIKSLQQLLNQKNILNKVVNGHTGQQIIHDGSYRSFKDGQHFKDNEFFSGTELRLSLCLYIDDFELCNPLGTSRKKLKIYAVYWILGNLPPGYIHHCPQLISLYYVKVVM